jgi:DNA-binding transcriptional LysR family regulator
MTQSFRSTTSSLATLAGWSTRPLLNFLTTFKADIVDKLESIQVFVAVAKSGGFSAAARALGVPVPTVSRRVAELETALGVRLFERSTRQVVLTSNAQTYFTACQRLLDDLRDADAAIGGENRSPRGELTVTGPVGFGRMHVQPIALDFLQAFPEVDLRLQFMDRVVNLVDEQVDIAIRISSLPDSSLIARNLGEVRMVICASPDYLERHGVPSHPLDLINHSCISWSSLGPLKSWLCRAEAAGQGGPDESMFPIRTRLTTTLPDSALEAAIAGIGLTQITSYLAAEAVRAGQLVPVLRDFEASPTPVSLVYPSNRMAPQKLRAFLDFAAPRLTDRLRAVAEVL